VNAIAPGALNTRLLDQVLAAGPERVGKDFYEKSLKQRDDGGADLTITYELDGKHIVEHWQSRSAPWTRPPPPVPRVSLLDQIDFGDVPVGGQRDFSLSVTNKGTGSGVLGLAVSGDAFVLQGNGCPAELNRGADCLVTVRFRPQQAGSTMGTLRATIDPGPEATTVLIGTGVERDAGPPDAGPPDTGAD